MKNYLTMKLNHLKYCTDPNGKNIQQLTFLCEFHIALCFFFTAWIFIYFEKDIPLIFRIVILLLAPVLAGYSAEIVLSTYGHVMKSLK